MRQIGHAIEHTPNNIGQSLIGGRQARPGAYYRGGVAAAENTPGMVGAFMINGGYRSDAPIPNAFVGLQSQQSTWDGYWGWSPESVHADLCAAAYPNTADGDGANCAANNADLETDTDSSGTDTSSDRETRTFCCLPNCRAWMRIKSVMHCFLRFVRHGATGVGTPTVQCVVSTE